MVVEIDEQSVRDQLVRDEEAVWIDFPQAALEVYQGPGSNQHSYGARVALGRKLLVRIKTAAFSVDAGV